MYTFVDHYRQGRAANKVQVLTKQISGSKTAAVKCVFLMTDTLPALAVMAPASCAKT